MPELRIAEFREILEDRDRLKTENESQRRTITALEKEARRAATLERELGRERSRHEVAKSRAKERMAEAGAYEAKLREAKAAARALEDDLEETQQRLRETLKAYDELAELEPLYEKARAAYGTATVDLAAARREITRLEEIEVKYNAIKGALK